MSTAGVIAIAIAAVVVLAAVSFLTLARRVVRSESSLLILGETGVGKELIARAVHNQSAREGAFVPVNPVLKAPQVGHILRDSGARILVTTRDRLESFRDELSSCSDLTAIVLVDDAGAPEVEASAMLLSRLGASQTGAEEPWAGAEDGPAAVLAGLLGWDPTTCDLDALRTLPDRLRANPEVEWPGGRTRANPRSIRPSSTAIPMVLAPPALMKCDSVATDQTSGTQK